MKTDVRRAGHHQPVWETIELGDKWRQISIDFLDIKNIPWLSTHDIYHIYQLHTAWSTNQHMDIGSALFCNVFAPRKQGVAKSGPNCRLNSRWTGVSFTCLLLIGVLRIWDNNSSFLQLPIFSHSPSSQFMKTLTVTQGPIHSTTTRLKVCKPFQPSSSLEVTLGYWPLPPWFAKRMECKRCQSALPLYCISISCPVNQHLALGLVESLVDPWKKESELDLIFLFIVSLLSAASY